MHNFFFIFSPSFVSSVLNMLSKQWGDSPLLFWFEVPKWGWMVFLHGLKGYSKFKNSNSLCCLSMIHFLFALWKRLIWLKVFVLKELKIGSNLYYFQSWIHCVKNEAFSTIARTKRRKQPCCILLGYQKLEFANIDKLLRHAAENLYIC